MRFNRVEKAEYQQLCIKASELERAKQFKEAFEVWLQAKGKKVHSRHKDWAEARAKFCKRQATRPF